MYASFSPLTKQVLNPLDAICDHPRKDAICVSQLKNARKVDEDILKETPDVKVFLPFRFFTYRPEMLFQPHTYNNFLGEYFGTWYFLLKKWHYTWIILNFQTAPFESFIKLFNIIYFIYQLLFSLISCNFNSADRWRRFNRFDRRDLVHVSLCPPDQSVLWHQPWPILQRRQKTSWLRR